MEKLLIQNKAPFHYEVIESIIVKYRELFNFNKEKIVVIYLDIKIRDNDYTFNKYIHEKYPKIIFKNIGWIASKNAVKICPLGKLLAKNSQTIIIEKNATETLNEQIKNRKANSNLIMIFADAMNPILPGYNIAPFKTGGFVGKFDILPIVIKYKNYTVDPTFRWFDGEDYFIGASKIALNDHIDVTLDVMDIQSCESNMSIEEYRDKVYNLMNKRYDEL